MELKNTAISKITKSSKKSARQNGFSLPELMVIVTLIVILSAIALMRFDVSKTQLKRQTAATQLKNSFERARFDSVKRRVSSSNADQRAKVVVNATNITLKTDVNNDADTVDTVDAQVIDFSGQNITITGFSSMTLPVTVDFNQRGEVKATDNSGATVNPTFLVCNGTCDSSNDSADNSSIVLVTPTGTVNLLSGGSPIPAFSPPPVANISANTAIKNTVSVP